jgi:hypothetical protein
MLPTFKVKNINNLVKTFKKNIGEPVWNSDLSQVISHGFLWLHRETCALSQQHVKCL